MSKIKKTIATILTTTLISTPALSYPGEALNTSIMQYLTEQIMWLYWEKVYKSNSTRDWLKRQEGRRYEECRNKDIVNKVAYGGKPDPKKISMRCCKTEWEGTDYSCLKLYEVNPISDELMKLISEKVIRVE